MVWTIAMVLFLLWVLGMVTGHVMGGLIYLLLVAAVITVLVRVVQGRAAV
jgi:hypothetical protein